MVVLPGTLIHEMAHLLVAGVTLVPVGDISLMPEIKENGVKLGHVEIQKTDFFRRALIGFAPVFVGIGILVGAVAFANSQFFSHGNYPVWLVLTLFYLVVVIGNTMFSSKKDLEGTLGFVVLLTSIFGTLYLLELNQVFSFFKNMVENNTGFFQNLTYFLALPVMGDVLVYAVAKLLVKRMY